MRDYRTIPHVCEYCTTTFLVTPSKHKAGRGRFCSPDCHYASVRTRDPDPTERFWSKVDKSGDCWIWTAKKLPRGYGQFSVTRRGYHLAHRFSYELVHGPIPDGLFVLHNCPSGDNPSCVNPDHLFLGTQADNVADMRQKGRGVRGERQGSSKLTVASVLEIRARHAAGESIPRLIKAFGVSEMTISRAVRRQSWKHVA